MKKTKLIPLLLMAPLLASCGLSKPKEPKFVEMGKKDKVGYAAFVDALTKVRDGHEFYSTKKLPSSVLTLESKNYSEEIVENDGKVKSKDVDTTNLKYVAKYDKANKLIQHEGEEKEEGSVKSSSGNSSSTFADKTTFVYQEAKVDNEKYIVRVNKELKEFTNYEKLGTKKAADAIDEKMKDLCIEWSYGMYSVNIEDLMMGYYYAEAFGEEAEVAKYAFYKKDKVFTAEYKSEEKDVVVKNASDQTVAKRTTKYLAKVQIDLTEGKAKVTSWYTQDATLKVSKDYYEQVSMTKFVPHYKGDVVKKSSQTLEETTFEHKDVKLKAVDISKFTKVGETW